MKIFVVHLFYQACGISLSLGLLLHGLMSCGHGGAIQLAKQHGKEWRSVLENKVINYEGDRKFLFLFVD